MKTIKLIPKCNIQNGANLISSHTLYNDKVLEDGQRQIKARIDPLVNEDNMSSDLNQDC